MIEAKVHFARVAGSARLREEHDAKQELAERSARARELTIGKAGS